MGINYEKNHNWFNFNQDSICYLQVKCVSYFQYITAEGDLVKIGFTIYI